jgi:phosphoserine aminotransferase
MRQDIVDFHGTRMGIMEISHRAPEIVGLLADTAARVRRILSLPREFEVLFLQGGGSLQFSMIPMNFSAPGARPRRCMTSSTTPRSTAAWPIAVPGR